MQNGHPSLIYRSAAVLSQLVENSPNGILLTDDKGIIIFWNSALEKISGTLAAEALGRYLWDIQYRWLPPEEKSPDAYEYLRATAHDLLQSGATARIGTTHEHLIETGQGERRYVQSTTVALHGMDGYQISSIVRDITLEHQQSRWLHILTQAFENAPITLYITDREGKVEFSNPRTQSKWLNAPTEENLTKSLASINELTALPDELHQHLLETVRAGGTWQGEVAVQKEDGEVRWDRVSVFPVIDERGNADHLVAVKEDITARKHAEANLRESERFARSVIDSLTSQIAIVDESGIILTVNSAWRAVAEAMSDTPELLCEGADYFKILNSTCCEPEQDSETARTLASGIQSVLRGKTDEFTLEYPCHSALGPLWLFTKITRFHGQGPIRLVIVHENVTDRKLGEIALQKTNQELETLQETLQRQNAQLETLFELRTEQLRRLNERMSIVLDNTADAILLLDDRDCIENANLAFDRLFGYAHDEMFGKPLLALAHPGSAQELGQALKAARETCAIQRVSLTVMKKDGISFDAELELAYVAEGEGHVICSLRDITHLKEVERAKDAFISMISHELRTPVASILLSAENLMHYYDRLPDERRLQKIGQMHDQAEMLTELVTGILDTIRFGRQKRAEDEEPAEMYQTMQDVLAELLPQAEAKGQKMEASGISSPVLVRARRTDLLRVWQNLVGNAIKYTNPGGMIRTHLYAPLDPAMNTAVEPAILRSLNGSIPPEIRNGEYLVCIVEDNGPGISEQDVARLFTRFFRGWAAKTEIPGTGLGLSLVKDIVQSYGGDIVVKSQQGIGTAFVFWLPVVKGITQ